MQTIKVNFRKYRDGQIIALFPEIGWGKYEVCSYMHIGQHGSADYTQIIAATKPATKEEYTPLLSELAAIGYGDIKPVKKARVNYPLV